MVLEKRHVFMNLLFEGLKRWEFLLGAEVMHERDGHLPSVEVAIPVGDMHLYADARAAYGGVAADIHEYGLVKKPEFGIGEAAGIDARSGAKLIFGHRDIGGGETDGAPQMPALDNLARECIRMAEHRIGFLYQGRL